MLAILLLLVTPVFAHAAPPTADAGAALSAFFGTLAGNTTWKGQVSFARTDDAGTLVPYEGAVEVYIHLRGPERWSVGAMICPPGTCYFEGDEIQWKGDGLTVFRYDGHTMPVRLIEATPTALAYSFTDPYGDEPTETLVHEEIRGNRFIRDTLIQTSGRIYEDTIFSVSRAD